MRFIILLVPFLILSVWTWHSILYLYEEIFLYQTFMEKANSVEWYHWFVNIFVMGFPLWLITLYFMYKKWQNHSNISNLESFYLFMSYIAFMFVLIGHMAHPIFWGTMLGIHILFLTLISIPKLCEI
jgi:hypothetical protein